MLLQIFCRHPKKIFFKTILKKMLYRFGRKQSSGKSSFKSEKKEDILRLTIPTKTRFVPDKAVRVLFFAPLKASLTIEAALVLPMFLFCMTAMLRYCTVMETAVKFGTALSETGKSLAITAYAERYGSGGENSSSAAVGVLSTAYAQSQVKSKAGDTSSVKNMNMLLSSFQEDDVIDLVLTYQVKTPFSVVKLPGTFFIQRARVRAWTGRTTEQESKDGEEEQSGEMVYVTATGSVYHEDPDCTHLKLSIHAVDTEALDTLRNRSGSIYHACEKCGASSGSTVYITNEGNRYHSSLSCSGLKRTVKEVSKDEIGTMRACSKCG